MHVDDKDVLLKVPTPQATQAVCPVALKNPALQAAHAVHAVPSL